jgi:Flp pilus assembly protein TadG
MNKMKLIVNYLRLKFVRSCLMKPRLQQRGQALILIALAAVGLFGFGALAIDGSRIFSDRRHAQNAADTAALAAALARVRAVGVNLDASGNPIQSAIDAATVDAGIKRAESNGYANDANSTVEVHMCNEPGLNPPCEGLLGGTNLSEYVQVKIVSTIPTTFARVIGRPQVTSLLTAVARAKSGIPSPLVNGNALAALAEHEPNAIDGGGNTYLDVNNSGIFSNSDVRDLADPCNEGSMLTNGNGDYYVDTSIQLAGTLCKKGIPNIDPSKVVPTTQIKYPPDITIPIPSISCGGSVPIPPPTKNAVGEWVYTLSPGTYGGGTLSTTGHINLKPGNYCFTNDFEIKGSAEMIANNVNMLISGGTLTLNGNTKFTCDQVIVHIQGGDGMKFNGNGENACNNVTFIASTGSVSWNGSVTNRFFAPTGGDYKNVLIYLPYPNNSELKINGNANNMLKGSIIAVASNIVLGGNNWTTGLNSQIIGFTIDLQGNSQTTINYVPGEQYAQIDPSGIQLTK